MFSLPLVALLPLQPLLAVQLAALLVVQDSVVALPLGTLAGLAFKSTVGAGVGAATLTLTERLAEVPAALAQVSTNVLLAVSGPRASEPEVALAPLQAPEALHEAAFVVDQVSVLVPCEATLVGLAAKLIVGAGAVVVLPPPSLKKYTLSSVLFTTITPFWDGT
jgi:hypothetical protein